MALFQRKPENSIVSSLYTVGLNNTIAVVGLGNIGAEYDGSRHNIGFASLDHFARSNEFPDFILKKDLKAHISTKTLGDSRVILIKPTTLMNLSGQAIDQVVRFYKIPTSNLLVVHDELDIEFGKIRSKIGGSSAGHNGVQSIIDTIGEGFCRLRIGIGPKTPQQIDSADFVLQKFSTKEKSHINELFIEADAMTTDYIFGDRGLIGETRSFII